MATNFEQTESFTTQQTDNTSGIDRLKLMLDDVYSANGIAVDNTTEDLERRAFPGKIR